MKKNIAILLITLLVTTLVSSDAYAHSGGTNANGCHTNRKTGDYHCHTPKAPQAGRQIYCHVINGERRCGYAYSTCQDLKSKYGGSCKAE